MTQLSIILDLSHLIVVFYLCLLARVRRCEASSYERRLSPRDGKFHKKSNTESATCSAKLLGSQADGLAFSFSLSPSPSSCCGRWYDGISKYGKEVGVLSGFCLNRVVTSMHVEKEH
ncbi:hypothetical protein RRG08_027682 [Elysia crispata]|uniref:Uncharacterized protein n=1 Tax=Elysia crispata TaxID=231223 RepID=A0AAE1CIK0_9GAST|nr:hypothetical protein RRG08_027682 [Elysia crispata]